MLSASYYQAELKDMALTAGGVWGLWASGVAFASVDG